MNVNAVSVSIKNENRTALFTNMDKAVLLQLKEDLHNYIANRNRIGSSNYYEWDGK